MCKCNREGCQWCDMSPTEQQEYINKPYEIQMSHAEAKRLTITKERQEEMSQEMEERKQYFYDLYINMGKTHEEADHESWLACLNDL